MNTVILGIEAYSAILDAGTDSLLDTDRGMTTYLVSWDGTTATRTDTLRPGTFIVTEINAIDANFYDSTIHMVNEDMQLMPVKHAPDVTVSSILEGIARDLGVPVQNVRLVDWDEGMPNPPEVQKAAYEVLMGRPGIGKSEYIDEDEEQVRLERLAAAEMPSEMEWLNAQDDPNDEVDAAVSEMLQKQGAVPYDDDWDDYSDEEKAERATRMAERSEEE